MKSWSCMIVVTLAALACDAADAQTCSESACEVTTATCDECILCAWNRPGYCAPLYAACVASADCMGYAACVDCGYPPPDPNPPVCTDPCALAYPDGLVLYSAVVDCILCIQCPGCETAVQWYDPYPGCGMGSGGAPPGGPTADAGSQIPAR